MARLTFDTTKEYISEIERASDASSICTIILERTRQFGFQSLLAGTMPRPGLNSAQQKAHVLLQQWPLEWVGRYFARGYLFKDPTIKRVRRLHSPFTWSELHEAKSDPLATRVMNEATDFGLRAGLTISVGTLEGDAAGFSLAGERIDIPDQAIGMVQLLATYGIGRAIMMLEGRQEIKAEITQREHEVIKWASEGKTEWEIGEILSVSERTIEKHIRNSMAKLNATNRTHLIAKALRQRLIE